MVTDLVAKRSVVTHGPDWQVNEGLGSRMAENGHSHSAIRSYIDRPYERSPRRVSDVVPSRQWRASAAYKALSDHMPEHQLSMITDLGPPMRGRGWVLTRGVRDFSDRDVQICRLLLPVLMVVGLMYDRLEPWRSVSATLPAGVGLTARELAVLALLARGLSSGSIARQLATSPRTVAKHLEHVYRKLGCKDRLVAVALARELGLT